MMWWKYGFEHIGTQRHNDSDTERFVVFSGLVLRFSGMLANIRSKLVKIYSIVQSNTLA
jgi:hypothetical protein